MIREAQHLLVTNISAYSSLLQGLKMFLAVSTLMLMLLAGSSLADIPSDQIKSLPGWNGALPSKQYSGYIKLDQTSGKHFHYW